MEIIDTDSNETTNVRPLCWFATLWCNAKWKLDILACMQVRLGYPSGGSSQGGGEMDWG